jgi:hypothetical protein
MKIDELTICLHTGLKNIMDKQIELLKPLESMGLQIYWNNRYDRHPDAYTSYSEMVNEAVATSKSEHLILINDRVIPKPKEILQMINHLENGFAASTFWSVAYMTTSKELFRVVGWWDQRFYGGGYEDDDYVIRLRANDVAYYESASGEYDKSFKTPIRVKDGDACSKSYSHFAQKWRITSNEIIRTIPEEKYEKWDKLIGERRYDISNEWMKWNSSIVGIDFPPFGTSTELKGESRTKWFYNYTNKNEIRKVIL